MKTKKIMLSLYDWVCNYKELVIILPIQLFALTFAIITLIIVVIR